MPPLLQWHLSRTLGLVVTIVCQVISVVAAFDKQPRPKANLDFKLYNSSIPAFTTCKLILPKSVFKVCRLLKYIPDIPLFSTIFTLERGTGAWSTTAVEMHTKKTYLFRYSRLSIVWLKWINCYVIRNVINEAIIHYLLKGIRIWLFSRYIFIHSFIHSFPKPLFLPGRLGRGGNSPKDLEIPHAFQLCLIAPLAQRQDGTKEGRRC